MVSGLYQETQLTNSSITLRHINYYLLFAQCASLKTVMVSHTHTSEQDIQEVKFKKSRKFKGDSVKILWEEKFFHRSRHG